MYNKVNYFLSTATAILSTLLGQFWFLFVFLLALNIVDYITGLIKARYLRQTNSKKGMIGAVKKVFIWVLVFLAFGLGIAFKQVGEVLQVNLGWLICIGYFTLAHCIVNEIRSILENIVQCDKGDIIPDWFKRGLEVTQKLTDKKVSSIIDKFDKEDEKDV